MASTRTKQQLQGERESEAASRADRCSRSPRPRSPSPTSSTPASKQQGVRRDQVDAAPAGERQAASLDGRGRCHDARFKGGATERLPKLEANLPSAASMDPEVKRFLGVVGCAPSGERRRTPCATIASFGTGSGCRGGVPGGARAARVTTARRAGTREAGARRAARARARGRCRARGRAPRGHAPEGRGHVSTHRRAARGARWAGRRLPPDGRAADAARGDARLDRAEQFKASVPRGGSLAIGSGGGGRSGAHPSRSPDHPVAAREVAVCASSARSRAQAQRSHGPWSQTPRAARAAASPSQRRKPHVVLFPYLQVQSKVATPNSTATATGRRFYPPVTLHTNPPQTPKEWRPRVNRMKNGCDCAVIVSSPREHFSCNTASA